MQSVTAFLFAIIRTRLRPAALPIMLAAAALLASATVQADERILAYTSDITIQADGSMEVTESIRVRAEGNQIQRGIFRDFPTSYRDHLRNRHVVDFEVLGVQRDGSVEPWFTESRANGIRVYIGSRNTTIAPGIYEYAIRYRTDWQLGFFDTHDELWWNVNGNDWGFPVDEISARISLPEAVGTDQITIEGWVGRYGSTEQSVTTEVIDGSSATISATRALEPGEGLSFAMGWPKGHVTEPSGWQKLERLLFNNRGLLIALAAFVVSLIYWLKAWSAHGRDPTPGTIFPLYQPPARLSPATARYLRKMKYDDKAFSAAVINLAVKGYLTIAEDDDDYTLKKASGSQQALAAGEKVLLQKLFADGDELLLKNDNHATMQAAMTAHKASLRHDNYRTHFAYNFIYVLPAIAILAGSIVAIAVLGAFSPLAVMFIIASLVMLLIFVFLMPAHTASGRSLLDRIEGFRLYLDVAEKDDLNTRNPPAMTPQLFETYLPYALALDVDQQWAEQFTASLPRGEADSYRPAWYSGHWSGGTGGFGSNLAAATTAVTGAVASSIASASIPPGTSSGIGGGGFSGGGGGGGGGGGW